MRNIFLASVFGLLSIVAFGQNWTGSNKTINSGDLRFGNGSELSINGTGNVQQPFYLSGGTWYKLTYSSYPLDFELASGGDGSSSWNRNGSIALNPTMTNQVFDQSGFIITSGSTGYGTLKVKGNVSIGSDLFEVTFTYYVAAVNDNFTKVTTSIKNIGSTTATNVRYWVGTRDDYVGVYDSNTKTKGNIVNGVFQQVPTAATQSRALQISNGADAVLFYTTSPLGNMSHASCCSFTNSTGLNPTTTPISTTGDGSYAMFIRLPDLGVGQTQTFEWYYAAGSLAELAQVVSQVASASITVNNVATTTAQLNAFSSNTATGSYIVVPSGSTAPSAAEVLAGTSYPGGSVVTSGNGSLTAGTTTGLNMTGLNPLTNYTVYFVSQYLSGGNTVTTSVTSQEFTTLFACGEIFSRVDGSAGSATCPAVSGTPYNSSVNGTAYTTAPTTTKTSTIRYKWSAATAPSIVPVISSVWINGISSAMQIGPPSVTTITAGEYFVDYCLYNVNLPTTGSYSVRFINPQTGNEVGICSYAADNTGIPVVTPVLVPNTMPTITPPANNCTGTSSTLNFTVADAETALDQLVVSATSSNTALLPNANITITQPNSSGAVSLAYNLISGQTGNTTITLTVLDHLGGTSTSTFIVGTPEIITISNSLCGANSLQWMTLNNVTSTTASGTGQNGITVAITHSVGGMQSNNGMYQPQDFPAQYNVPGIGTPVIQNNLAGDFQACFSQPVVNPVVAFSSIGNPTTPVTVTVSQPYTQVWSGTGTTWTSNTQFIGQEGDNIIRIDGTVTCVNFNYGTSETYATIAFGFENQNCYTPTICSGNSVTLTASGSTSYSWTPSSGLNTTTGASVVATPSTTTTYTVSNPSNVCATPKSITVAVNTTPAISNTLSNQTVCAAASISSQTFTSLVTGTTYAWTNSNTAIGLAASGSGSIPAFTAQNNTSAPITATITVTPTSPTLCVGATRTYTITVNPTPSVSAVANQNLCSGTSTAAINFTGSLAGSTYSWTNNNTAIGLAASGSGNINSFTATNNTANPITSTITVTPSLNSCQGTASTFTLTTNPIPNVTAISNQSLCAGIATTAVNFSGAVTGTAYTWSNTNTSIGLAASGSGDIPSFTATNSTTSNLSGLVTVTPTANGCTGNTQSFTIAVRTVPTVVVPNDQVYIVGATVPSQTFTGSIPGTVYNWTNSNSAIGIPAIGNGDINSFTAANNTSSPITSTITVTPTNQFSYTVYRTHNGNGSLTQYTDYVMNANDFDNLFNVANSNTTVWSNGTTNPTILLNWQGYTNLNAAGISTPGGDYFGVRIAGSFTAAETGVYTFELQGDDAVDLFLNGVVAVAHYGGHGMTSNTGTISLVAGQTYSLVARHQEYGGGEGFILRWKRPSQSTFSIQPDELAGCDGSPQAFTITVDPIPNVNQPANVTNCEGALTSVDFTGTTANTNYLWTNSNTSIGLAASGSNDLSFTTQNPTNVAQSATVTVTPQAYVTEGYVWGSVNENGSLTLTAPAGKVFTNVAFASYGTPSGSAGNYTLGACNAATSNSVISDLAIGNSTMSVIANNATFGDPCSTSSKALAVKLGYGVSVSGVPQTFTITVNPSATIANSSDTICTGAAFTFATASTDIVPANTTYTWSVVNNSNINGATSQATSSATMSQTIYNASSVNQTQTYTVTPSSGAAGCVGAPFTYNVTVTPLPTTISTTGSTTFCDGGSVTLIAPVAPIGMSYTYQWNLNGAPITGATSISYIANASGSYTVTVTNNAGCSATSLAVVVTENPLPTVAAITGTTTVCVGSTTTLSSLTAGGSWTSSNTAIATVNATTGVVTGVEAGSVAITYTVTNGNGCTNSQSAAITVNALPSATILTGGPTNFCQGATVTLTASPQIAGSTYLWSNGATTASIVVNSTSTNTVTITNSAGCSTSASAVTVTVNPLPIATITASGATTFCQGGSVTLTANAGTGLSYQWSNASNNQTLTVSTAGSYTVTVTDANGCSNTSTATVVTVNSLPTAPVVTGTTAVCVGSTTLLSTTASSPVWSSANSGVATIAANGLVTGVSAGTVAITCTTTNANSCVNSQTVSVTVNTLPTAAISTLGATTFCQGGSVDLLASSAPAGMVYTYQWRLNGAAITGATSSTYVANATGAYAVTITTNSGCSATSAATNVTVNPLPVLAANAGATTVCEGSTAVINNAQAGGLWSTANNTVAAINATTGVVTGVNPGTTTLTYTYTNANGCTNTVSTNFTVNSLPSAVITANGSTTFCQGGSVVLTASTGTSYLWSTGATTQSITVTTTQDITVTVTNSNGCASTSAPTSVVVNPLPLANITSLSANSFCQGGSVTLVSSTGSAYSWSNGAITQSITLTASASVTVTVTDANGCSATSAPFTVTMNPTPVATITAGGPTTFCSGSSVALTAPVAASYLWSSGETTQSIIASVDGPYSVTITDGNGCTATSANTNITVLSVPTVQAIAGSNSVCVGNTTTLTNATIGGTWSSLNASVATINSVGLLTGVSNGTATITYSVSNANGCTTTVEFNVNINSNPVLTANTGSAALCVGANSTLANAQAGGTWSSSDVAVATVAANGTVSGIIAGTAVITYSYTNASGCTSQVSTSIQVNALPVATVSASSTTTFCAGGSVTLTAPSGMTYAWSTGESTQSITVSTSGSYSVTITNSNGCSATSAPVTVTVNALPAVSIANVGATTFCAGGSVTLIAPLNSNFTYSWNNGASAIPGASNNTYVANTTGSYTLTVTDANGCTATSSAIPVTVNALPVVTATANGATTFCDGGSVTLSAAGAATYQWSNGATTPSITVSTSDNYSVIGTTLDGCTSVSNAISVVVNALPVASITSSGSTVCLGSTVTLTAAGGASYSWSNGSTNPTINITAANTYTATVTSAEGCTSIASETVVFNANPAVVISANGPTVFCTGGSLTLTATGGSNYVWSNGDQGATTTVNQSGNYYVIVTNAAGCTTQSSVVNVTVNSNPVVAPITGANTVCEGGFMQLTSATLGGSWTAANNFIANIDGAGNVTGLNAGTTTVTYTVTINGCTASTSAQVSVLNNPVIPTITASGNTTLCPGGSVVLFASNGANYQWSSGATTPYMVADQSGAYTVSVTSVNGCSATSLPVQVFIGDNTAPIITAPLNVTTTPNLGCEAIGVALGNPITSDNCGVASVTNDAPSIFPVGPTVVTWTVTDNSGNTSTATQVVTVVDNNAPIVQAPANVSIASNVYCEAVGVELGNPIATDNCTNNLTITNNAPSVYPLGTTIVTWTVVDGAGNVTSVEQTVTVTDASAPQVLLANTSVILDANGYASISFDDLNNGSVDNCGIASTILSQSEFDCSHAGENLITVYVIDNSGNQSSASVLVTVVASDACGGSQWSGPTVPDAFTPNGNNYNDTWVIPGLEGYTTKKMEIYSRYGTIVYGADSYNNDWDGTLLNTGTPVPDGTYYYILTLNGGKQLNGYVYINRVQK